MQKAPFARIAFALAFGSSGAALSFTHISAARAAEGEVDVSPRLPFPSPTAGPVHLPVTGLEAGETSLRAQVAFALRPSSLPLVLGGDRKPIDSMFGSELGIAFGITSRVTGTVAQPIALHQFAQPGVASSALGDTSVGLFATLKDNRQGGLGIAALGELVLPTGDPSSLMSERNARGGGSLCAEYTLLFASVSARAGYRARGGRITFDPTVTNLAIRDEVPFAIALALRPGFLGIDQDTRQRFELGLRATIPAGPTAPFGISGESAPITPAWLVVGHRIDLGRSRDLALVSGIEWGFTGSAIAAPLRVLAQLVFTPRAHDADGDGIPDDRDKCPASPEDKDGVEDDDGCPDLDMAPTVDGEDKDSDGDGIPDDIDQCPSQRGVASATYEKNGCPP